MGLPRSSGSQRRKQALRHLSSPKLRGHQVGYEQKKEWGVSPGQEGVELEPEFPSRGITCWRGPPGLRWHPHTCALYEGQLILYQGHCNKSVSAREVMTTKEDGNGD